MIKSESVNQPTQIIIKHVALEGGGKGAAPFSDNVLFLLTLHAYLVYFYERSLIDRLPQSF